MVLKCGCVFSSTDVPGTRNVTAEIIFGRDLKFLVVRYACLQKKSFCLILCFLFFEKTKDTFITQTPWQLLENSQGLMLHGTKTQVQKELGRLPE